jgi:nucleoid-associated protein YgaU
MFKDSKSKFPPGDKSPTFLPAKAASTKPWTPVSDKDGSKRSSGYGEGPGSTQPFAHESPRPFPDGRSDAPKDNPFVGRKPQKNAENEFGVVVSDEKSNHRKPRDEFGRGDADGGLAGVEPLAPAPEPPKPFPDDRLDRHDRSKSGDFADQKHPRKAESEFGIVVSDDKPNHRKPREEFGRGDADGGLAGIDSRSYQAAPPMWDEPSSGGKSHSLPPPPNSVVSRSKFNDRHRNDDFDRPSYGSLPPLRDDGKYEVQPNDSFWTISEKVYQTGSYFKALAEENRAAGIDENNLKPGQLVSIPPRAQLEKSYPDLCPKSGRNETLPNRFSTASNRNPYRSGRIYTVAEGDTLFNIARYELGKASRWAEIYEMNRDLLGNDYNYLKPGTQLTLPANEKTDVLTRQPREVYQR